MLLHLVPEVLLLFPSHHPLVPTTGANTRVDPSRVVLLFQKKNWIPIITRDHLQGLSLLFHTFVCSLLHVLSLSHSHTHTRYLLLFERWQNQPLLELTSSLFLSFMNHSAWIHKSACSALALSDWGGGFGLDGVLVCSTIDGSHLCLNRVSLSIPVIVARARASVAFVAHDTRGQMLTRCNWRTNQGAFLFTFVCMKYFRALNGN